MGKIRNGLKIMLPTIIIGAGGMTYGKGINSCKYEMARYELRLTQPSCKEVKKKIEYLKNSDEELLFKYLKGKFGEIEAHNDYITKKCK